MIPQIKKILYTTDLSKNSAYAFRYAINSATQHDADIHILHVLEIRLLPLGLPKCGEDMDVIILNSRIIVTRRAV